jgi:hypothetical protein
VHFGAGLEQIDFFPAKNIFHYLHMNLFVVGQNELDLIFAECLVVEILEVLVEDPEKLETEAEPVARLRKPGVVGQLQEEHQLVEKALAEAEAGY